MAASWDNSEGPGPGGAARGGTGHKAAAQHSDGKVSWFHQARRKGKNIYLCIVFIWDGNEEL